MAMMRSRLCLATIVTFLAMCWSPRLRAEERVPNVDADGLCNLARLPGAKASASITRRKSAEPAAGTGRLRDGRYGSQYAWTATSEPAWCEIDLGETCRVSAVALGSDHRGKDRHRAPKVFRVLAGGETRANGWREVLYHEGEPAISTRRFEFTPLLTRRIRVELLASVAGPSRVDELEIYGRPADQIDLAIPRRTPSEALVLRRRIERLARRVEHSVERLAMWNDRFETHHIGRSVDRYRQSSQETEDLEQLRDALAGLNRLQLELLHREPRQPLEAILFVKHHPYRPTHIYTEYRAAFRPGGGIYLLQPDGSVERIFDGSDGVCRDPDMSYDADKILFSYRGSEDDSFHIYEIGLDRSSLRQLTEGPYNDMYPTFLPDGRIVFVSTRGNSRVFCNPTEAATLCIMDSNGGDLRRLSANNLNEFSPSVLPDGRILFTRWEYQDKGAALNQSLWAVRPDGTMLCHVFGNTIAGPMSYLGARCVPGTGEIVATLGPHLGDHVGPIGLIARSAGDKNPEAIRNLTPDYLTFPIDFPRGEASFYGNYHRIFGYRDPYPLLSDWFLASYGPTGHFRLCLLHRDGVRVELLEDPEISCFQPIPLRPRPRPPVITPHQPPAASHATVLLQDVYQGLEPTVHRGEVKHVRVVEEVRHDLTPLCGGTCASRLEFSRRNFDTVHGMQGRGPLPSYVVKRVLGIAPVEADGSACFHVPADTPIYFQVLDEHLHELQRMRSVVYLRAGETQGCIGCHESRRSAPRPAALPLALAQPPRQLKPPDFGLRSFDYLQHCLHEDKMLAQARSGYSAATELANELVRRDGLDYRTAHDVVQTFILESVRQGLPSYEAKIEIFQAAAQEVVGRKLSISEEQVRQALDPVHFVKVTNCRGGVAPESRCRIVQT